MEEDGDVGVASEGDEVGEAIIVEVCGGEFGEVWECCFDCLLESEVGDLVVCVCGVVVDVDVVVGVGDCELVWAEFGEGCGVCGEVVEGADGVGVVCA